MTGNLTAISTSPVCNVCFVVLSAWLYLPGSTRSILYSQFLIHDFCLCFRNILAIHNNRGNNKMQWVINEPRIKAQHCTNEHNVLTMVLMTGGEGMFSILINKIDKDHTF